MNEESGIPEIIRARTALERARRQQRRDAVTAAQHQLRAAVEAASDAGVTWMQIGDILGMARGNAYQQYRRRPHQVDVRRDSA